MLLLAADLDCSKAKVDSRIFNPVLLPFSRSASPPDPPLSGRNQSNALTAWPILGPPDIDLTMLHLAWSGGVTLYPILQRHSTLNLKSPPSRCKHACIPAPVLCWTVGPPTWTELGWRLGIRIPGSLTRHIPGHGWGCVGLPGLLPTHSHPWQRRPWLCAV